MEAVAAADSAAEATAATAVAAATEGGKEGSGSNRAVATAPSADAQWGASLFPDSNVEDVDDDDDADNGDVAVGGVGGRPPRKVVVVIGGSALSRKQPCRPSPSDDDVVDVGRCGGRENDDNSPPSAFPIPASGGNVGGNVGGSGNNNNSGTKGTNMNKSVCRRRKMYSEST